jgi:hypothetical protein
MPSVMLVLGVDQEGHWRLFIIHFLARKGREWVRNHKGPTHLRGTVI